MAPTSGAGGMGTQAENPVDPIANRVPPQVACARAAVTGSEVEYHGVKAGARGEARCGNPLRLFPDDTVIG